MWTNRSKNAGRRWGTIHFSSEKGGPPVGLGWRHHRHIMVIHMVISIITIITQSIVTVIVMIMTIISITMNQVYPFPVLSFFFPFFFKFFFSFFSFFFPILSFFVLTSLCGFLTFCSKSASSASSAFSFANPLCVYAFSRGPVGMPPMDLQGVSVWWPPLGYIDF